MINRGIIPQYVDLTSALVSSSSALRNERVRFHDLEELKMRREIAETHGDAPLNVQLDGDVLARKVDVKFICSFWNLYAPLFPTTSLNFFSYFFDKKTIPVIFHNSVWLVLYFQN